MRLIWADSLRGLLILLVVLGHSLQHGDFENRLAWNIIYSFHMAAFFVISGYVGYKREYAVSSLWGKAQQLLLPFVTWAFLESFIRGDGFNGVFNTILKPDNGYWFVFVLFVILLLFISITTICQKLRVKNDYLLWGGVILLIIAMVLTEFRLLGFQFISLYFGFYVLGYMLNKYKIKMPITIVIVLGLLWISMALFWRMHAVPVPLQWATSYIPASLLTYGYRYVTALLGSLFFIGFAMLCMDKENKICRVFAYFGGISLEIYIVHLCLFKFVEPLYIELFPSDTSLFFVVSDIFLKVFLSILIVRIIQKVPIAQLLLFGKR